MQSLARCSTFGGIACLDHQCVLTQVVQKQSRQTVVVINFLNKVEGEWRATYVNERSSCI